MADYCTLAQVKANPDLGLSATDSSIDYDVVLSSLITEASRLIDQQVGKWANYFYPSSDTETRYFTGDEDCLEIDEAVSITSVAVSEGGEITSTGYTAWAATDYILGPDNYTAKSEPIRTITIDTLNGTHYSFYGYRRGVKVVGIFGYSATPPAEIRRACIIQTVSMFMQDKQGWRDAGASAELGQLVYNRNIHPVAAEILQQYKNKAIV